MSRAFAHITTIDKQSATGEYGTQCQRIFPGEIADDTFGSMVCWLAPNSSTALDEHNQRELVIVLSGEGWITSGNDTQQIAADEVVMIERGYPHMLHSGSVELHFISVFWPRIEPTHANENR